MHRHLMIQIHVKNKVRGDQDHPGLCYMSVKIYFLQSSGLNVLELSDHGLRRCLGAERADNDGNKA